MWRFLVLGFVLALAIPAWAQKINMATPNHDRVVEVHTALNHLSVIEVGEPVTTVAAGSAAFKIEWRDNKVFIEPNEPDVNTNLFIWTASGRLNYELESAGAVEKMDFAIDYPKPASPPPTARPVNPSASIVPANAQTKQYAMDPMLGGEPVRTEFIKPPENRVAVLLKDLFEQQDTLFIRYEIRNSTAGVYVPGMPKVFLLHGVSSSVSLVGREHSQLGEPEVRKLYWKDQTPLPVVDGKLRSRKLRPGEETVGVVAVKSSHSPESLQILRLEFPSNGRSIVAATLVL